ncbi:hypothetical protein MBLNU230_g8036t1 [Neophaeotheca triangularis]
MHMFSILTKHRRKSTDSGTASSLKSSHSSPDRDLLDATLPIAPRDDDDNMMSKAREMRLLSKCKRRAAAESGKAMAQGG